MGDPNIVDSSLAGVQLLPPCIQSKEEVSCVAKVLSNNTFGVGNQQIQKWHQGLNRSVSTAG